MPSLINSVVHTNRLLLISWTLDLIDAFLCESRDKAEQALSVRFPEPFGPPPETGDVLAYFRSMVADDDSDAAFVPRLIVRTADRLVVGSIGINPPDDHGQAMTGYSVYPAFEGNGYASEAAKALCDWAMEQSGIASIKATIRAGHTASEIVATRAGLTRSGAQEEDEGMTLNVWLRTG